VLGNFAVGALVPTLILLGYNQLAFGSPWDMGYFHHTTKMFADVHSAQNPLGLRRPEAVKAWALLWGRHRGLLFYAPVVALVPAGLVALAVRKSWGMALVSSAVMTAVFAVNLSYPEWTGGWSTGPRLLVPLLPFAMLPVAALLAWGGRWASALTALLALGGRRADAPIRGGRGAVPGLSHRPARAGGIASLDGRKGCRLGGRTVRAKRAQRARPGDCRSASPSARNGCNLLRSCCRKAWRSG